MAPLLKDTNITPNSSNDEDDDKVLDVVIIGAGWAGLSAAKELQETNATLSVQILEGRDTIGGRCRTLTLQDGVSVAELGAQWIHGAKPKTNPVYDAALASGIDMARSNYSSRVAYQNAANNNNNKAMEVVSQDKLEEMTDKLMGGKQGFFKYQERRQDRDDKDVSLRQCADEYLAKIHATDEDRRWLNYILDSEISQEYAGSLEDMSMFWWDSDGEIKGGDVHLAQNPESGYRGVLQHFARTIQDTIQLNSKVTCIDYSESGDNCVAVQYTHKGDPKCVIARRVLVTVPVGVLQAKSIQFEPALPKAKQIAIDRMGVGLYNKCVFLWDDADAEKLPWPQDKEWMEKIVSASSETPQGLWTEFFNSQPVTGRPMLCAFTAGRIAEEMEQYTDQEIQASAMKALRAIFPDSGIPEPIQVVVTKWGQDEFARGSYSFNAMGGKHSGRKQLAAPVDQKLYFAGEACHSQYFGTTHGALLSGVASAKQIISHAKKNKTATTSGGKVSSVMNAFRSTQSAVAAS